MIDLTKRATIIQSDNWEALYIDGELITQHNQINFNEDRGLFFLKLNEKYNLNSDDFKILVSNSKLSEYLKSSHKFPKKWIEVLRLTGNYAPITKNRAVIIYTDTWEILFVDEEFVKQCHKLNSLDDLYFLMIAEKYNLKYNDFDIIEASKKAYEYLEEEGEFPTNWEEIINLFY